ncbi:MAG: hypothetical protein ABI899_02280, partial [Actinomycetota bacterium]
EVLDPQARGDHSGQDLSLLGVLASQLASSIRLAENYDSIGAELVRMMADPEGSGEIDVALSQITSGVPAMAMRDLALAFRVVAEAGPEATQLATKILRDVAAFSRTRT